ncbi:facilitated trehalose transporter Tret1-like isoform X1 [Daphnia pulicaria]|uniref:facilitated trehalose transporter Tret1-like isoform X1 n=2 Tax=Daphnia pulicaria TaxID=35523 RepID=UPI001EEAFDC7|nr:facilitated trehalose transporter Tret1-like isoform X1 [Daphnia pulicaria]
MESAITDNEIDFSKANKRPQILAALAAAFSAFVMGTTFGWSSPVQPQLQQNSTLNTVVDQNSTWYIDLDDDQMSWVGSLINIGASVGAICGGYLMDRFGRVFVLMAVSIPFFTGWLFIVLAVDPLMLYVGRLLGGLAAGICCAVAPCYIGEISIPDIRGTVGYFFSTNIGLGILFTQILGLGLDWRFISGVCAITPLVLFALLYFVPESPYFLVKNNKIDKAAKSLQWLRGNLFNVEAELAQIKSRVIEDKTQQLNLRDFLRPWAYKPILIGIAVMVFQQFSGLNAALFYSVEILQVAGSNLDALVSAVVVIITLLIGNFLGAVVVGRLGRRPLFMISEAIACLSMCVLGSYFYILTNDPEAAKPLAWLPLTSLIVFISGIGMGLGPLPWIISSEVLPAKIRGQGSSIAALANFGLSFIVTKTFIDIQRAVTPAGAFWFYGGFCLLGILFALFLLPETKDKTSEQIEAFFVTPNHNVE